MKRRSNKVADVKVASVLVIEGSHKYDGVFIQITTHFKMKTIKQQSVYKCSTFIFNKSINQACM